MQVSLRLSDCLPPRVQQGASPTSPSGITATTADRPTFCLYRPLPCMIFGTEQSLQLARFPSTDCLPPRVQRSAPPLPFWYNRDNCKSADILFTQTATTHDIWDRTKLTVVSHRWGPSDAITVPLNTYLRHASVTFLKNWSLHPYQFLATCAPYLCTVITVQSTGHRHKLYFTGRTVYEDWTTVCLQRPQNPLTSTSLTYFILPYFLPPIPTPHLHPILKLILPQVRTGIA